jgi:hypothetical protein
MGTGEVVSRYRSPMTDGDGPSARLLLALADLTQIAAAIRPQDAPGEFDETVTEVFYRDWPTIRSWAESLWQHLNGDLGRAALPDADPKSPETGTGD